MIGQSVCMILLKEKNSPIDNRKSVNIDVLESLVERAQQNAKVIPKIKLNNLKNPLKTISLKNS